MSTEPIGAKLRRLREAAGLTQAGLADVMGSNPATVSRMETGLREITLPLLESWAAACGYAVGLTFRRLDEPAPDDGLPPPPRRIPTDEREQIAADLRRALARLEKA